MVALIHNNLQDKALWVRQQLWEMTIRAGRGHLPSCFSCVDALVSLYYGGVMNFTPSNPKAPNRDRFIMSKGHAAAALYPILADLGFFSTDELERYTQPNSLLGMYADPEIPGIESISDSLGHGLGIGCGFAVAGKHNGASYRTYVMLGDAECNEGSVWESAAFASHYGLDNLVAIVDYNRLGVLGEPVALGNLAHSGDHGAHWPVNSLYDRWGSFGWAVYRANGHNFDELLTALQFPGCPPRTPVVLIADTIKGKGVPFMEGRPEWHNRVPNYEEAAIGRKALGYA